MSKGKCPRPAQPVFSRAKRVWRSLVGVLLVMAAGASALGSWESAPGERRPSLDEVEAAYLYNFGKFVRWPGNAGQGPVLICVAGPDPLAQTVRKLVLGEQIDGRPLQVRVLDGTEEASSCSILFVGALERQHEDEYLAATAGKPVLTVGDAPDFLARGGILELLLVGDHVRFSVNLNAANRNGLSLSSELLKVAIRVTGLPGDGGVK